MIPKFRAWDGERIVKVLTIGWTDGEIDWIDTSKVGGPVEDFIVIQSTGVKDDYGYDLYEGDIVEVHRNTLDRYVIRFVDGGFVFASNYGDRFSYMHIHVFLEADYEIIKLGNIFEHPHLLEGVDE